MYRIHCDRPVIHFNFSQIHFASPHAKVLNRGFCNRGTSCAINNRPRGSIHKPKMGKKLKMPPTMSRIATTRRTPKEDGLSNHRMDCETLTGTRRSIISKYLFNSAFVVAIPALAPDDLQYGKTLPGKLVPRRCNRIAFGKRQRVNSGL